VANSDDVTILHLVTGEVLAVEGAVDAVAKQVENASRSGVGTLAWFDEAESEGRLGVNPSHVVAIRRAPE